MGSFPVKTSAYITCNFSPTNESNVMKLPYLTALNAARSSFRCVIFSFLNHCIFLYDIWALISTLSFSHSSLLFYMNYKTKRLRTMCVLIHQSFVSSNTEETRPAYEMCSERRRWVQASTGAVKRGSETSLGSVQEREKWEQFWNCAVRRGSENSFGTVHWKRKQE